MADRNGFETEHLWVEERLSAYIDAQLAPLERAQLERHLRDCARCQASLASLRWAVALVKQAPAPAVPRQFTLPLPAQARRAPAYGFAIARLATAVATLLLFAVFGLDVLSRLGGGFSASAPAPAALREAVKPTSIALAPTEPANVAQPAAPTAAPAPAFAPTAAPPAPAAVPPSAPTEITGLGGAPAETSVADNTAKSAAATPTTLRVQAPARAPAVSATPAATSRPAGAASVPTATPVPATATPPPTATATPIPPTATLPRPSPTLAVQALVQPTVASLPPRQVETAAPVVEPLRIAEIGLFFFVVFFGALTVMLRRK